MESNHHGCFHPQGPQPCASTSSATAARGATILDVWRVRGVWLRLSGCGGRLANKCSDVLTTAVERRRVWRGAGSDQEAEGDLRLHPSLCGEDGIPADGAGDRQGGGVALVLDRARAPRQPGEDRPAQTRSFQAA